MTTENNTIYAFNRGLISKLALGRLDLKRTALSAETQTNWMPRVLGSMMLRPGFEYIGPTKDNAAAVHLPFVFSQDDTAIIELTADFMRVRVDEIIIERGSVSSAVTNGTFDANVTSWTDDDGAGATSVWVTGGYMGLTGSGIDYAKRYQEITVGAPDQNDEHGLRIIINRGPVDLKVGTSAGDDSYIAATLGTGEHSLALTPTGNFFIQFQSRSDHQVLVDSVAVEASGDMEIATNWDGDDISNIRGVQSGDIIFSACKGQKQQKIERRATRSWSVVDYDAEDGPFRVQNVGPTTITPSGLSGSVTLTASDDLFETGHAGALFKIESTGQEVEETITAHEVFTDPIKVSGVGTARTFTMAISGVSGTGSGVTLQRSIAEVGSWTDESTWTSDITRAWTDTLNNQVVYFRLGVITGNYSGGTLLTSLDYSVGSISGVAKITTVTNSKSATALVLDSLGGTDATDDWSEGSWSDYRGWPTAGEFYEGRLFWAGQEKIYGSVSDAFYSFDGETVGDSGPLNRSIGSGPVDSINWLVGGKTLLVGGEGTVRSVRSSSLDEILTPTNTNLKDVTTLGAANVAAVKVDKQTMFIQASGTRSYEIVFDPGYYEYDTIDLTAIVPEVGEPSITKIVVQRQPDARVHHLRSDGKVAVLVYDKVEEVRCWVLVETDGDIEDIIILPGSLEDKVYYLVNRTINSSTKRYLEKWSLESECKGATINKLADSHLVYSGASTDTITGLAHLEGETVTVWGNTKNLGTYTVASGEITISEDVTYCVVGLSYVADFKSAKAALQSQFGSSLLQKKTIPQLGVVLANTHHDGLQYGADFDDLMSLPDVINGAEVTADTVWEEFDGEAFAFPGKWDTDSRICLRATAPKPATVLAAVAVWNVNEKI